MRKKESSPSGEKTVRYLRGGEAKEDGKLELHSVTSCKTSHLSYDPRDMFKRWERRKEKWEEEG